MAVIRFSDAALVDIEHILRSSHQNFGAVARLRYELLLTVALQDIALDPYRVGSVERPEIGATVRSYHLRHSRDRARHSTGIVKRPRHFMIYRALDTNVVGIGRVLYDAMELEQHAPSDYGQS
ncbi:type II toxin-antitoxin system RelE/ParE family toxin [Rhizobium sp. RU36D]|uniref:type II toxin-antitoxin system RelE/ParE family toxin n=1 Tax=Rhizobium sp. RU36D TaxID=1907415 RepID=UPI0009D89FBE|nr:type II toxin-antitoxin system RelE/ParE family toxin [Rhizobium sp. RU36D]SMC43762.1 toxin ParE1/3/4 [Rhizobium sp. RU36D]